MKDGRISYLMKTPRRGSSHRVMTPMEFMARLAVLVPPPFYPLVRYHGVFAARSKIVNVGRAFGPRISLDGVHPTGIASGFAVSPRP
jgi:hypothetical protein